METIFDYNPTELEMKRFGIQARFGDIDNQINLMKEMNAKSPDDNNYQLGLLFAMRGDMEKSDKYFSQIEDKTMLRTLVEDF